MSLLQRRHYNHLAEMAEEIDGSLEGYKSVKQEVRAIILKYMMRANVNFDAHRFAKASGWYLLEE